MACFPARTLGAVGFLLALFSLPVQADPIFVRVYGRTYKIDPRYPSDEQNGPKPQEAMKALPSDLAKGPGFRPSNEQVLAEVEERLWIAQNQLDRALGKGAASPDGRNSGSAPKPDSQKIAESLAAGSASGRSSELQKLFDQRRALNLLARELRRSMDLPVRTPEEGFSRPKLSPEIEASYRALNFNPLEAYYGFRRVRAAFRSGDIELLAQVAHFPLTVTGKAKHTIRTREQLRAEKVTVMAPRIRDVVAKSTFETAFVRDKGMMLGEGEVWITRDKTGFGLGAISLR